MWDVAELRRDIDRLEELNPRLLAYRVEQLTKSTESTRGILIKVGVAVVGSAVAVMVTVLVGLH